MKQIARAVVIWAAMVLAVVVPIAVAASSPLLAWRDPIYVVAGFAGVVGLAFLLVQPSLMGAYLPGISPAMSRRAHRAIGGALVAVTVVHVGGLWITSPPDVVDALLFASPTPFALWGVLAMWAVFAAAGLAALRKRLRIPLPVWRLCHTVLALVIVAGTVLHALLIEGTMGMVSKAVLCGCVAAVTAKVILDRRVWVRAGA